MAATKPSRSVEASTATTTVAPEASTTTTVAPEASTTTTVAPEASPALSDVALINLYKDVEAQVDYGKRGQWLRAAVLGANDGLVSTASLMMGVGAVKADARAMLLSGLAGLVGGACSMAIGEFVSVYAQLDVELSQLKREKDTDEKEEALPNPFQAASASALAFTAGAVVPLLSAAFIAEHWVRMGVVVAASSVALAVFGAVGAYVGKSPVLKASVRVLVGGWAAMLVTYGILRLFASVGI